MKDSFSNHLPLESGAEAKISTSGNRAPLPLLGPGREGGRAHPGATTAPRAPPPPPPGRAARGPREKHASGRAQGPARPGPARPSPRPPLRFPPPPLSARSDLRAPPRPYLTPPRERHWPLPPLIKPAPRLPLASCPPRRRAPRRLPRPSPGASRRDLTSNGSVNAHRPRSLARRAVNHAAASPASTIGPVTPFRAFVSPHWLIGSERGPRLGEKQASGAGLALGGESIGQ